MPAAGDDVRHMVDEYLRILRTAGDYALAIQPRLPPPEELPAKAGRNAWTRAITDADRAVQNYVEVETLARFPGVGFYGEEQAHSLNASYFPASAELQVWLDPVNGTYLYQHRRRGWDIILSISRHRRLEAVISYQPPIGRFHVALRDHGAFSVGRERPSLKSGAPLKIVAVSGVCLTYESPALKAALRRTGIDAVDIVEDDDPAAGRDNLNAIFSGRIGAYASVVGDLLDWGAMALLVTEAGGVATAPDGAPLTLFDDFGMRTEAMIVSAGPEVHCRLLAALADRS